MTGMAPRLEVELMDFALHTSTPRWTPGLGLAILLRTSWSNLVGKRRSQRPRRPGLA